MKYLSKLNYFKKEIKAQVYLNKQTNKIPGSAKKQEKKQTRRKKYEVKNGGATKKKDWEDL